MTAPMAETNRAVVRPAFSRSRDLATMSVPQRAETEHLADDRFHARGTADPGDRIGDRPMASVADVRGAGALLGSWHCRSPAGRQPSTQTEYATVTAVPGVSSSAR